MFVLFEPQCVDLEHVEVNAALVASVRAAFPGEPVLFLGAPEHIGAIRAKLGPTPGVRFAPVALAGRAAPQHERLRFELRSFRRVLAFAARHRARGLLFCSISTASLFALKANMFTGPSPPCAVIPHAVLETLVLPPPRSLPGRLFSFRTALAAPTPPKLRYLLLASAFVDRVAALMPKLRPSLASIEHPYLFSPAPPVPTRAEGALTIGTIGCATVAKGHLQVISLAESVRRSLPAGRTVDFLHVGWVSDPALAPLRGAVRMVGRDGWTERGVYEREVAKLDYVLFPYPAHAYQLTASGALMDALSLRKPVLALRTPYFDHCFRTFGPMGFLCDSLDELRAAVLRLATEPSAELYREQLAAIDRAREGLSPTQVGDRLRDAWTRWWRPTAPGAAA